MNTKGIDNSINDIKNKLKGLSNEKVEINGKVNIDDTNLKKVGNNSDMRGLVQLVFLIVQLIREFLLL